MFSIKCARSVKVKCSERIEATAAQYKYSSKSNMISIA